MSELNPCPICGCSVRVWAKRFDEEDVEYIIECDNDFCGLTYGISCGYNRDEIKKAWNSVTALSPTVSEDCVSRQSVLDLLGDWVYEWEYDEVAELVEKLPPVTPTERKPVMTESERPKGEWIKSYLNECCGTDENHNPVFRKTPCVKCDQCGEKRRGEEKFCPNCGADMRGEKE